MLEVIPFNVPQINPADISAVSEALSSGNVVSPGLECQRAEGLIEEISGGVRAMLTPSCTAALEMAALASGVGPDDEVIMPSYTFVSTANAFALRGANLVFIDVNVRTMCIDVEQVIAAVTVRTKAIVFVTYGGFADGLRELRQFADERGILLIEDSAQSIGASIEGRAIGSIGHLACFSFHSSKNLHCGEGGALVINDKELVEPLELIREKGTDRKKFLDGAREKYTWQSLGSSYLVPEYAAAFLRSQLLRVREISAQRVDIWNRYLRFFESSEWDLLWPAPSNSHNGHLFFIIFPDIEKSEVFLSAMSSRGIQTLRHYVPLHSSPFISSRPLVSKHPLPNTTGAAPRLIRLPIWPGIENHMGRIESALELSLSRVSSV